MNKMMLNDINNILKTALITNYMYNKYPSGFPLNMKCTFSQDKNFY